MSKPIISKVQSFLQTAYQLDAAVANLPSEYDFNFSVRAADGTRFVLKIMHPDQPADLVDLQIKVLNHLAGRLPVPNVVPLANGGQIGRFQGKMAWLITHLDGRLYAEVRQQTAVLRHNLGQTLGQLNLALASFDHPAMHRHLKWDLSQAGWIAEHLNLIKDDEQRAMVQQFLTTYETAVSPLLPQFPTQPIHNDANDYNLLVQNEQLSGLIDFGDLLVSPRVCEVAIAAAYALFNQPDPLAAATEVITGYHAINPLSEAEVSSLFNLIAMRLCVSVVVSAQRKQKTPDDPYLTISEAPAWAALEKLAAIHPRFAHYRFRDACGFVAVPVEQRLTKWLRANSFASVLEIELKTTPSIVFDLSAGSLLLGANPAHVETAVFTRLLDDEMAKQGAAIGIGRYNEPRLIYRNALFSDGSHPTQPRRTVHLGIDLWVAANTPIFAPLAGQVHILANNAAPQDYGPLIILKHQSDEGDIFYTLYGHLSPQTVDHLAEGQQVAAGELIGWIGAPPGNGDWPPHLHFQIITDLLDLGRDFPGVAYPQQRGVWCSLSPDPNLILGIPQERFPSAEPTSKETLLTRREKIGRNLSLSYRQPLKIVRGWMQYLYDEAGQAYLDMYNNVPHVGHSHPHVVTAVQQQIALLNTNTRYLHDNINRYANKLTSLLPDPLSVCYFVNSGSEANELALRLARAASGEEDIVVLEGAYHGHTSSLINISPYKFNGPGGQGAKSWVHTVPVADDYRGQYKRHDPNAGQKYAQQVADCIAKLRAKERGFAAFIAESLPSVGGQIVFPAGYLTAVYEHVHAAGGITIADEVQTGFGRLGSHFWGFEMQGVTPDIVVLGKPIGNAFPLAAVVTTPAIAKAFDNGMEFFSTFGGNPVACAAGTAVLEVIEQEQRQQHALKIGQLLLERLNQLKEQYTIIGDVRGSGLFLGIELVTNRHTLAPAAAEASKIVNRLRDAHILAGTDGPLHNVIKLRPPLPFTEADAAYFLTSLKNILEELA